MAALSSRSIENACVSLTLEEEETEVLHIDDEDISDACVDQRFALVERLATDKHIKFQVMRDTLASVWRPGKGVNITEIAPNLFMYQFFH